MREERRLKIGRYLATLLFGEAARGPDEECRLQFEAVAQIDPGEKAVVQSVLEGLLLKHDARRWIKSGAGG